MFFLKEGINIMGSNEVLEFGQSLESITLEGQRDGLGVHTFAREVEVPVHDDLLFAAHPMLQENCCGRVESAPAVAADLEAVVLIL